MAVDWKRMRKEYISGGASYRGLAEKYGVSRASVERRAKAEAWVDKKRQAEGKSMAQTVEAVAAAGARVDTTVQDIACLLLERMRESIGKLSVVDAQSLNSYSASLERIQRIRGEKSAADMEEQKARIDKLRREAEDKNAGGTTITVRLEGDMDEYSG